MTRKLVRNTSTKESRDWWKAIEAAARDVPRLDPMPEVSRPSSGRGGSSRPNGPGALRHKKK